MWYAWYEYLCSTVDLVCFFLQLQRNYARIKWRRQSVSTKEGGRVEALNRILTSVLTLLLIAHKGIDYCINQRALFIAMSFMLISSSKD